MAVLVSYSSHNDSLQPNQTHVLLQTDTACKASMITASLYNQIIIIVPNEQ